MIDRALSAEITRLLALYKAIAVIGPRQSGKTTLCKNLFPEYSYFSLDLASAVEEIAHSPELFFRSLPDCIE
ncbi:MAG: AAA family ATPase [Chitinispirillales bacterium]|jgi:predicted AAA+ superfamily ATPase|nr:AAA family ATPase [Chitinispirillales bacterium]